MTNLREEEEIIAICNQEDNHWMIQPGFLTTSEMNDFTTNATKGTSAHDKKAAWEDNCSQDHRHQKNITLTDHNLIKYVRNFK